MRRILLITLAFLVGSTALLALYIAWDNDPDAISPTVELPSYRSMFEAAVQRRVNKAWASLDEAGRRKVLGELVASREADPIREVALYEARSLADKEAAFGILRKSLMSLPNDLFEVAIGSLATLNTPKSTGLLDSLHRTLQADPAAHTPLGGYRMSTLVATASGADVNFDYKERSRYDADYNASRAPEISLFFPANPTYFVAVPNADDQLDRFNESRFVKSLEGTPVPEDAWALPIMRTIHALRERLTESMGFMAQYFSPEQLFRDNMLVGRYGEEYLFASFKDKNVTVAETMVGIFETLGKDFGIRRWTVGGVTVAAVVNKKSNKRLCYAVDGNYFLVSTDSALITRSLHTYHADKSASLAIDPIFQKAYNSIDQTGNREAVFAWFNPTTYFGVVGSKNPAAARFAIVSRALGRPMQAVHPASRITESFQAMPRMIASSYMGGEEPTSLWRYVVDVRSLGKNALDSLTRLSRVDIGKQIMPYLAPSMLVGYGGVDYLREAYGYANTSFNLMGVIPMKPGAPPLFENSVRTFFSRVTTLDYRADTVDLPIAGRVRLWMGRDTLTSDSVLMERKLQPSFAIVNDMLLVAATPKLLRELATHMAGTRGNDMNSFSKEYFQFALRVDSLATNAAGYMRTYLVRTDRYSQEEIDARIGSLTKAITMYDRLTFQATYAADGLRTGSGVLAAKK